MKKRINNYRIFFILGILILIPIVVSSAPKTTIYFFYSPSCPYCQDMKSFLSSYKDKNQNLEIFELSITQESSVILYSALAKVYSVEGADDFPVPIVFIGDKYFLGSSELVKTQLKNELSHCARIGCPSPLEKTLVEDNQLKKSGGISLPPNSLIIFGSFVFVILVIWFIVEFIKQAKNK